MSAAKSWKQDQKKNIVSYTLQGNDLTAVDISQLSDFAKGDVTQKKNDLTDQVESKYDDYSLAVLLQQQPSDKEAFVRGFTSAAEQKEEVEKAKSKVLAAAQAGGSSVLDQNELGKIENDLLQMDFRDVRRGFENPLQAFSSTAAGILTGDELRKIESEVESPGSDVESILKDLSGGGLQNLLETFELGLSGSAVHTDNSGGLALLLGSLKTKLKDVSDSSGWKAVVTKDFSKAEKSTLAQALSFYRRRKFGRKGLRVFDKSSGGFCSVAQDGDVSTIRASGHLELEADRIVFRTGPLQTSISELVFGLHQEIQDLRTSLKDVTSNLYNNIVELTKFNSILVNEIMKEKSPEEKANFISASLGVVGSGTDPSGSTGFPEILAANLTQRYLVQKELYLAKTGNDYETAQGELALVQRYLEGLSTGDIAPRLAEGARAEKLYLDMVFQGEVLPLASDGGLVIPGVNPDTAFNVVCRALLSRKFSVSQLRVLCKFFSDQARQNPLQNENSLLRVLDVFGVPETLAVSGGADMVVSGGAERDQYEQDIETWLTTVASNPLRGQQLHYRLANTSSFDTPPVLFSPGHPRQEAGMSFRFHSEKGSQLDPLLMAEGVRNAAKNFADLRGIMSATGEDLSFFVPGSDPEGGKRFGYGSQGTTESYDVYFLSFQTSRQDVGELSGSFGVSGELIDDNSGNFVGNPADAMDTFGYVQSNSSRFTTGNSHMVLNTTPGGPMVNGEDNTLKQVAALATVVHEYFHSIQFGQRNELEQILGGSSEGTATAVEVLMFSKMVEKSQILNEDSKNKIIAAYVNPDLSGQGAEMVAESTWSTFNIDKNMAASRVLIDPVITTPDNVLGINAEITYTSFLFWVCLAGLATQKTHSEKLDREARWFIDFYASMKSVVAEEGETNGVETALWTKAMFRALDAGQPWDVFPLLDLSGQPKEDSSFFPASGTSGETSAQFLARFTLLRHRVLCYAVQVIHKEDFACNTSLKLMLRSAGSKTFMEQNLATASPSVPGSSWLTETLPQQTSGLEGTLLISKIYVDNPTGFKYLTTSVASQ